jgi:hypothetical protein
MYSVQKNWEDSADMEFPDIFIDCVDKDENGNRIAFPNLSEE